MNREKSCRRLSACICALGLILLLAGPIAALAQKISVQGPSVVPVGKDYFQIRYVIDAGDVENFRGPDLSDFDLLSGPNVSQSHVSMTVNGRHTSESSTTYTYTLAPRTKGKFRLSPATATVAGRRISSQPFTVTVSGEAAGPAGGAQPSRPEEMRRPSGGRVGESDLFMTGSASRRSVYNGEAVVLTYDVYFRPGIGLHEAGPARKPDFKGVVTQDIPLNNIQSRVERRGGQTYEAGTVYKTVVFPQVDGPLTIPAVTFDCVVAQMSPMLDVMDAFFNSGSVVRTKHKRTAPALTIDVKPLPRPAPAGFTDAVGHFEAKAELLDGKRETNDFCTYRITISGNGNLNMLTPPVVNFPSDFDALAPKSDVQSSVTAEGMSGKAVFDYVFVPQKAGHYEIPVQTFVYFDPQAEVYRTQQLPAIPLDIVQGKRTNADVERDLALRAGDIRDIRRGAAASRRVYGLFALAGAYAALAVVAVLTVVLLRRRSASGATGVWGSRRMRRDLSGRMRTAEKLIGGDTRAFHAALSAALCEAVACKCGVTAAEVGAGSVIGLLEQHGVAPDEARAAQEVLDACDFAQFAGSASATDCRALFEKTKDLLNRM